MKKMIFIVLNVLVIVGLAVFGGFYFKKYRDLQPKYATAVKDAETYKTNPQAAAQEEQNRLIEEVGKVYDLPKDEKPSQIAKVDNDPAKLATLKQDQPFFAKAEPGDVTFIYTNSKLAILYRPSTKQLINVASVSITDNTTPTPTP